MSCYKRKCIKIGFLYCTFQIHNGVNGRVVDDDTGEGIPEVVVSVFGIEKNITTDESGYFWRLLTEGQIKLTFSKPGYVH